MNTDNTKLCVLPWIHLEVQPNGYITQCCVNKNFVTDQDNNPININTATITSAWNCSSIKMNREQFLEGKIPSGCENCFKDENSSYTSLRQRKNEEFKYVFNKISKSMLAASPVSLDLKFGNLCNLKCRICSPEQSSSWYQESISHNEVTHLKESINLYSWPSNNQNFWNDLFNHIQDIQKIDIYGGEPLLIKEHVDFLKMCIQTKHSEHISLCYSTNGTIYSDELINQIWPYFSIF